MEKLRCAMKPGSTDDIFQIRFLKHEPNWRAFNSLEKGSRQNKVEKVPKMESKKKTVLHMLKDYNSLSRVKIQ
ncbi:hypothetical protein NDU88_010356 [Pleurodeles waltl]|uniref:Uncharacterized protein n=1 Tax=Pleurodeles waltl TaxID=8319 RepID=A0AAV7PXN7_PLEWA|nr:hypothetical protein NDU88_010356 [Pleurodeles waltl]